MDCIQKFYSDVEKIRKFSRSNNGGRYDGEKVCREISGLFIKENRQTESVAAAFADYWMETYILGSSDIGNEPSQENISKLASMYALLLNDTDQIQDLSDDDWKELCSIVNAEAEDLPLDFLNDLMAVFLDHQAF